MREFPLYLIPLLPLLGAVFCLSVGRRIDRFTLAAISSGTVIAAFIVALHAILSPGDGLFTLWKHWHEGQAAPALKIVAFDWIHVGSLRIDAKFVLDPLSAVMVLVVTGIGSLIHVYSYGYMNEDPGFHRFMGYLNLFTGCMLILVTGGNLVLMFVGWEGVGLCSYLLIGFWYTENENATAGRKAFVVNRIGDAGFLLGVFLLIHLVGTVDFADLSKAAAPGTDGFRALTTPGWGHFWWVTWACWFLFIGACGKSAQVPLYVWLADAMKGPTPVSALIHAATMVTAGVYMIARLNFLYVLAPAAMATVAVVGCITALFAALMGCAATDLKKVLAYSTVSQLGFMFVGVGTGTFTAGVFHLVTHAFFKACLFLGAGAVLFSLHHAKQVDIRELGGMAKKIPVTRWTFLVSCLAIAGVPGLSGFFSKDEILWSAFSHGNLALRGTFANLTLIIYGVMLLTACITAFYMFRLYFLVFSGTPRSEQVGHAHEPPTSIVTPLRVLAVGAVVAGVLGLPHFLHGAPVIGHYTGLLDHWLKPVMSQGAFKLATTHVPVRPFANHSLEMIMSLVSFVGMSGIAVAYFMYGSGRPRISTGQASPLVAVAHRGFLVDELYDLIIVRPYRAMSRALWQRMDKALIDTLMVRGSAAVTDGFGRVLRLVQNGDVQRYVAVLLVGGAVFLSLVARPSSMFVYRVEAGSRTVAVQPPRLQFAEGQVKKGVIYEWEFPDPGGKVTKAGPAAEHTFSKPGSYTIKLRVKDATWGTSSTTSRVVTVPAPGSN